VSQQDRGDLPDYDRPPVIEVVIGAQFEPISLPAVGIGLFWNRLRDRYPTPSDRPPIGQRFERFDADQAGAPELSIEALAAPPLPRLFMEDESGNWVLQLQQDRLLHNWRKKTDDDVYPRYEVVYNRFLEAWQDWLGFLPDIGQEAPRVNQLELTYVNHVPQGEGWEDVGDVGNVFPSIGWHPTGEFLPAPEGLNWRAQFRMPDDAGRLHVAVQQAVRRADRRLVLLCELTARGYPRDGDMDGWFGMGREWIVRGFTDLTSREAHESLWGRKAVK
jgi:uncharacterized protein (TIGR04255 family)